MRVRGRAFSIPRLSQFRLRACTLEEVLAHGATSIGPALIIGEPGERLPRLGGSREYVPDNEWQTAVTRLMAHSSRMFFVAGDTPNLGWELRTAVAQFGLNRVVLVLPPLRDRQIEARWHRFTNEPGLPSLPEDSSGLVLVTFVDGAPVLFKTDQRRLWSYLVALWLLEILHHQVGIRTVAEMTAFLGSTLPILELSDRRNDVYRTGVSEQPGESRRPTRGR